LCLSCRRPARSALSPYTTLFRSETALAAAEARDRAAGRASLRPLLQPASVAVVGAGRRGGVGHEVLKGLVRYGFHGPVYPINPRSEEHTSELQSRENLVCRLLLE